MVKKSIVLRALLVLGLFILHLRAFTVKGDSLVGPSADVRQHNLSQQFKKEKGWFLTRGNKIRGDITTTTGLALVAERHYKGDTNLAYDRGLKILSVHNQDPRYLFWFRLNMDSNTFFEKQSRLYNTDGLVREEYRYAEGQALYAQKWHNGDLYKAYEEVLLLVKVPKISLLFPEAREFPNQLSILLPLAIIHEDGFGSIHRAKLTYPEKVLFRHLGWSNFPISHSAKHWRKKRSFFVDPKGTIRPQWQGIRGQIQYAKQYTGGDLYLAWREQKYVFGHSPNGLNWYPVWISGLRVEGAWQVENIISRFLEGEGSAFSPAGDNLFLDLGRTNTSLMSYKAGEHFVLKPHYRGGTGYLLYALEHTGGDLGLGFKHSLYLPPSGQKDLKWYPYIGSIEERTRDQVFIANHKGMEGLKHLAHIYYKGNLEIAYKNVLSIFNGDSEKLYRELGYLPFKAYAGSYKKNLIAFYERDTKSLILKNGKLNPIYRGMKGYINFANKLYGGDMQIAYNNAQAVLDKKFTANGWVLFPGTTTELKELAHYVRSNSVSVFLAKNTGEQMISALAVGFMAKNNLISAYKENIRAKVRAFLQIQSLGVCEKIAFL